AKMTSCGETGCVPMSATLALSRLKNRVDPQFPAFVISQLKDPPVTVRVKARINEKGDATTSELHGGNPLLYSAVGAAFDQWKFSPLVMQGGSRCVDTEIPIVINVTRR